MAQVLVVDDQVMIRDLLRKALSERGHEVAAVPTGRQALASLAAKLYDLIILDLDLGAESGLNVITQLRELQKKVPIVIYSGTFTPEIEEEARQAGANEVLSKELGLVKLIDTLEKIVKAKERIFSEDPLKSRETVILVVDDEVGIRRLLVDFFKMKGFRVVAAENGKKAIETVKTERPSLALLDIGLPDMDGLEVLKQIKEMDSAMGVVMMTGAEGVNTIKQAIELGAYSYIMKPFDFLYLELVVLSKLAIAKGA